MNANQKKALEDARKPSGAFGERPRNSGGLTLEPEIPTTYRLDFVYNNGENESFTVDADGWLPSPVQSDSLKLTRLLGFRVKAYTPSIDLSFTYAVDNPASAIAMLPVFDTTYDSPTTVFGVTTMFEKLTG